MKFFPSLSLILIAVIAYGCGPTGTTKKDTPPPPDDFGEYIAANESTFHPEDFGIESWESEHGEPSVGDWAFPEGDRTAAEPDTLPGFRVQVMITREFDRAAMLRDSLSSLIPGEWVYVVYHPPYYKIRVGNYPDRPGARAMLDRIRRDGFPDAWIVPDRVLRYPPTVPDPGSGEESDGDGAPDPGDQPR